MFLHTHSPENPWVIVKGNNKQVARMEAMRYVLKQLDYPEKPKAKVSFEPNPQTIRVFDVSMI
jgi:hypothetical protein